MTTHENDTWIAKKELKVDDLQAALDWRDFIHASIEVAEMVDKCTSKRKILHKRDF